MTGVPTFFIQVFLLGFRKFFSEVYGYMAENRVTEGEEFSKAI